MSFLICENTFTLTQYLKITLNSSLSIWIFRAKNSTFVNWQKCCGFGAKIQIQCKHQKYNFCQKLILFMWFSNTVSKVVNSQDFFALSFRITCLRVRRHCFLACWRVQICRRIITAGILGFQLREEVGNAANGFGVRNIVQVQVQWRPTWFFRVQMEHIELFKNSRFNHFILPGNWNGAGVEPVVKWTIGGIWKTKSEKLRQN